MGAGRVTVLLDTNFLILALTPGTPQDALLRRWLAAGDAVRVSVVVWAEFLCGPVTTAQAGFAKAVVGEPEALLTADAARAAELFNATGRRRRSLADCLIAATALRLGATLATENSPTSTGSHRWGFRSRPRLDVTASPTPGMLTRPSSLSVDYLAMDAQWGPIRLSVSREARPAADAGSRFAVSRSGARARHQSA